MRKKIRVLVTGIGSGVGQSIYKSLLLSKLNLKIFIGDIDFLNVGVCLSKNYIKLPLVEKKGSLNKIIQILKINKIDILFIGSELDIIFFSKFKKIIYEKTKTIVSLSNQNIISTYSDKYEFIKILKKNKITYPKTFEANKKNINNKKLIFPLILKGKTGTSSKNVFIINNLKELKLIVNLIDNPIIQEYLGNNKDKLNEYTCSFFKTREKKIIGPFLGKRNIKFGTSWIFENIFNKDLKSVIMKISKIDEFEGSINIQLKYHNGKFVPFEINPRFSGTTVLRAIQGFNEPEMYIKNFFLKQKIKQPIIKKKGIFFRYIEEKITTLKNLENLKN